MRTVLTSVLVAFTLLLGGALSAHASLIGQTVTCFDDGGFFDSFCNVASNTVGPGVEFEILADFDPDPPEVRWQVDIDANSVTLAYVGSSSSLGGPSLLTLGDLYWSNDPLATLVGIANFVSVGAAGVMASDVMTDDHSLVIDYGDSQWLAGDFVSFDLLTVPEPGTALLVGLGLLGLARPRRARSLS